MEMVSVAYACKAWLKRVSCVVTVDDASGYSFEELIAVKLFTGISRTSHGPVNVGGHAVQCLLCSIINTDRDCVCM